MEMMKTYSELITIPTFKERFEYLKLSGIVGDETFGGRRLLNQKLYHSKEWIEFRDRIIVRDLGRDLAAEGFEIYGPILIHHINPISYEDILKRSQDIFNPDNVVCTTLSTHNAIHYGNEESLRYLPPVERTKNDTCPWKH